MTERAIALVGLRCSGKTSVGRELAARLGRTLVDLDREIALAAGHESAGQVIERLGLESFRALERTALADALDAEGAPVLATGGGVVEDPANRALLIERSHPVWLRASAGVLAARMAADPTLRPSLTGADPGAEIDALALRREPLYREVARDTIDTDDLDAAGVASALAARLAT
jgi:shikimate kinase